VLAALVRAETRRALSIVDAPDAHDAVAEGGRVAAVMVGLAPLERLAGRAGEE
jgi:hypothetical protein